VLKLLGGGEKRSKSTVLFEGSDKIGQAAKETVKGGGGERGAKHGVENSPKIGPFK